MTAAAIDLSRCYRLRRRHYRLLHRRPPHFRLLSIRSHAVLASTADLPISATLRRLRLGHLHHPHSRRPHVHSL